MVAILAKACPWLCEGRCSVCIYECVGVFSVRGPADVGSVGPFITPSLQNATRASLTCSYLPMPTSLNKMLPVPALTRSYTHPYTFDVL